MAEKAASLIKNAQEHIKQLQYPDALMDLDVAMNFQRTNVNIYMLQCSIYLKNDMIDEIYKAIENARISCSEADIEKLNIPLQKYYEKKDMPQENLQILHKICEKNIKQTSGEDVSRVERSFQEYAKVQIQWITSVRFIELKDQENQIEAERTRTFSLCINFLTLKGISSQTQSLIFYLYASLVTKTTHKSKYQQAVNELQQITKFLNKDLSDTVIEEAIFLLARNMKGLNMISERNILIGNIFGHFQNSIFGLCYQLEYFAVIQSLLHKRIASFMESVYQALCQFFYKDFREAQFQMRFCTFKSENENNVKVDSPLLDDMEINQMLDEFRIRAEIFMLFAHMTFNLIDFPKKAEPNLRVFEDRVLEYLNQYDVISAKESNNLGELEDDSIYGNPLFESYLLSVFTVWKQRGKATLLDNLKKTIDRFDRKQEDIIFLKEIYYKQSLKITNDGDELVVIKNNLKNLISIDKNNMNSLKLYYDYIIRLNKSFRIYDGSIPIPEIISTVLSREPDNIQFKSEQLWIAFTNSPNHLEFFNANISTFEWLYESAVLVNLKELASVIQKRIVIMKYLFVESANPDDLLSSLEIAKKLDQTDYQLYVCAGVILFSIGKHKEALEQLQTAFIYHQKDVMLNKMIFLCMNKLGQLQEGVDFLHRIYPAFKQIFWINRILGVHFSNTSDYKRATQFCQRALELYQFDKDRNYRLHYEKNSKLSPSLQLDIPHMMDYDGFLYFDDYLVWSDSFYSAEAINLSSSLTLDPSNRIHVKLCISLAQTDKMQGKTCSSLAAIEEAEEIYFSYLSKNDDPNSNLRIQSAEELKSPQAKDVFDCLRVIETVFASCYVQSEEILKKYDFNEKPEHLLDALVINFEFAQIASYLSNSFLSYQRVRIFLVICCEILERLHKVDPNHKLISKVVELFEQMTGFILELGLNYVKFHLKKYTYSSAIFLVEKLMKIKVPAQRTVLVNVALAEFYTFSGFLKKDKVLVQNSIEYLKAVLSEVGIDFNSQIINSVDKSAVNKLHQKKQDLFKYALKNITLSYFYLYKLDQSNEQVFKTSLTAASAGILFFNTDTDFYNYYGLIQKDVKIKIGAFVKSNRIQKNSLSLDSLGFIYLESQRYEEAANMFLKSIEVDPTNATAYIGLFVIQYNMGLEFNKIICSCNDDERGSYQALQTEMIEKCGSYLHYVKQIEINASTILFDSLLELIQYQNSRSHVSYHFSTDLFDRAPFLMDTQLGTLQRLMILKQSQIPKKKLEMFNQIKDTIDPTNFPRLFLDKVTALDSKFLELVQARIKVDNENFIKMINSIIDFADPMLNTAIQELELLMKNFKLSLSLALHIKEYQTGLDFFRRQIELFKTSIPIIKMVCEAAASFYDLLPIYKAITELEYQLAKKVGEEDINQLLKRLSNLNQFNQQIRIEEWPFSVSFIEKVTNPAELKYLQGVHNYKLKNYAVSKKCFFAAIQLDPFNKSYRGHYFEYLLTQERMPVINSYVMAASNGDLLTLAGKQFEQKFLVNINHHDFTLQQKISQLRKAAMYLDKPYLYYLLVHFSFEDPQNYSPSRLIKLMILLRSKVLNNKADSEGAFQKKGMKLYIELYQAAINFNSNDSEVQSQLQECALFMQSKISTDQKLSSYSEIIKMYYNDINSSEFVAFLKQLLEGDRINAYILVFNLIRKLFRQNKTKGMIELLSSLSQSIFSAVQSGVIEQKVLTKKKGKMMFNLLQHIDGYQYLLALQEDFRTDSAYEKADIQEMIHNWATYCHKNYPGNVGMSFIQLQHLFRQQNMTPLKNHIQSLENTTQTSRSDTFMILIFRSLYYYLLSTKNPNQENIGQFFQIIEEIDEQYKNLLTSSLNTLLHFLQGVVYLKIAESRKDLDKNIILREFKLALLFGPEYASTIQKFLTV